MPPTPDVVIAGFDAVANQSGRAIPDGGRWQGKITKWEGEDDDEEKEKEGEGRRELGEDEVRRAAEWRSRRRQETDQRFRKQTQ